MTPDRAPDDADIQQALAFFRACEAGRGRGPRIAIAMGLGLMALTGAGIQPVFWPFGPLVPGILGFGAAVLVERRFPLLIPRSFMTGWLVVATVLIGVLPLLTPVPPGQAFAAAGGLFGALLALRGMSVLTGDTETAVNLELARRLAALPADERRKTLDALRRYREDMTRGDGPDEDQDDDQGEPRP